MFSSSLHAVSTLLFLAPALTVAHQNNNERAPRRVACDIYSAGAKCQYDYIVVGGGTAGLVVATRLSSDPRVTVAVVEAGGSGKDNDEIDIPALIGTPFGTDLDWKVSTVPQAHSNNISYYWPRGKVLGGSSALNFLVWDRAAKAEYDAWEALGNPGWNWNTIDNILKNNVEHFHPPPDSVAKKFHIVPKLSKMGTSGPVQTSITAFLPDFATAFISSFKKLGVPECTDPLSGNNIGAGFTPSAIDPATRGRSYSASAYLWPNEHRSNLKVISNATVTKVNLARQGSKYEATGVNFRMGGEDYTIGAQREVIISAGSVMTPQLLELSGIGQKELLNKYGIDVKIDLPGVGENLQDHVYIANAYMLKDGNPTPDLLRGNATLSAEALDAWHHQKPSLLDSAVTGIAYATLPQLVGQSAANKIIAHAHTQTKAPSRFGKQYKLQLDALSGSGHGIGQMELILFNGYIASGTPVAGKTYITFLAALQRPLSRGSIHVNSSDPFTLPTTDPRYFEKDFDLEVTTLGAKALRKLADTKPFSDFIASEARPGSEVNTDAEWREYVKTYLSTEYHPIGTAALLPQQDGGVVDHRLKVYGTTNLRVADASIMPMQIAAHMQATVYAIGELAAKFIKETYGDS